MGILVKNLVDELCERMVVKGRDFMSQDIIESGECEDYPSELGNFENLLLQMPQDIQDDYQNFQNDVIDRCSWDGNLNQESSNQSEINKYYPFHKKIFEWLYDYLEENFGVSWLEADISKDDLESIN